MLYTLGEEPPRDHEHTIKVINEVIETGSFNFFPYTNIALSCDNPPVIDYGTDPILAADTTDVSLFWPDGHPTSIKPRHFETLHFGYQVTENGGQIARQVLLRASIGQTALGSIPLNVQMWRRRFDQRHNGEGALVASAAYAAHLAPFGICQIGIVRSSRSVPPGTRVAGLWHPLLVSPQVVLDQVKEALDKTTP